MWSQGHEDLRQDERVMQLFGLVNTMLAHDRTTAERDLSIARYAVIPLSPNSGDLAQTYHTDQTTQSSLCSTSFYTLPSATSKNLNVARPSKVLS